MKRIAFVMFMLLAAAGAGLTFSSAMASTTSTSQTFASAAAIQPSLIGFHTQYTDPQGVLLAGQIVGTGPLVGGWSTQAVIELTGTGIQVMTTFNDDPAAPNTYRWPGGIDPAFGFARQVDTCNPICPE